MFISKAEKTSILLRLTVLEEMVKSVYLERREKLEKSQKKSTLGWTQEARAKHSERIKKMWADKRKEKLA